MLFVIVNVNEIYCEMIEIEIEKYREQVVFRKVEVDFFRNKWKCD